MLSLPHILSTVEGLGLPHSLEHQFLPVRNFYTNLVEDEQAQRFFPTCSYRKLNLTCLYTCYLQHDYLQGEQFFGAPE